MAGLRVYESREKCAALRIKKKQAYSYLTKNLHSKQIDTVLPRNYEAINEITVIVEAAAHLRLSLHQ